MDDSASMVPPHVSGSPRHDHHDREPMPPAPEPSPVNANAPEESLRDVPLPEGYLNRLRRFVDDL